MRIMDFSAIVSGSGQAGVPLATRLARGGKKVPLTERADLGGTCIFHGAPRSVLVAMALALACSLPARGAEEARVREVGCAGVTVLDLDRSLAFYEKVLDFRKELEEEDTGAPYEALTGVFALRTRTARVRLGAECIDLTEYLGPKGRLFPANARSNDRSFQHVAIVVADMDRAYARLRAAKVEHASSGPQRLPDWNPKAAGIRAFYFRDPDRHVLEVIWFPAGKGAPRWQERPRGALFLGIDHTAIVVADTQTSLRLYRDVLGLAVAGESDNHGDEQARLNGVEGAHLRITTLRAARGPGVELLQYLAPAGGRPYPADARPNDLIHWQTTLRVASLDEAGRAALGAGATLASRAPADLAGSRLGLLRALLVRDPDGHALLLAESRPALVRPGSP
jgi:catechol 2,3-dioxygenase-like lactoylglutathione lyase family enzyme